ncbi:hypothetical protein [Moritella viscosa]|uniref:Uncharacterized protein n=1 Tax=Moritella viscosa TaxID=80854 RepID=A0A1L0AJC5_9GAMM|nr:hypothetical protein [Moritella viscosa]SGY87541.1 Putative uncharacterized protein [Moritella viscosa]
MSTNIVIQMPIPVMSIPKYAKETGQTECAVAAQMDRGVIPFTQHQHRATRFVNIAKLTVKCLEEDTKRPWLA